MMVAMQKLDVLMILSIVMITMLVPEILAILLMDAKTKKSTVFLEMLV
jgi:hypothetical protein